MNPRSRSFRAWSHVATVGVVLVVAACAGDSDAPHWVERDSAGVTIVDSDPGRAPRIDASRLVVSIGTVGSGGPAELHRVRDVELVDGEQVAVANQGTEEIRVFGLDGALVRRFGREGRGPREFTRLSMVQDVGDSLFTYDGGNDRISVRHREGDFARSFKLEWFSGALAPVDIAPTGRVLSITGRYMTELVGTGVVVDSALVSVYDLDGRLVDSIGRFAHNERFVKQVGELRTTVAAPFTVWASLALVGDGFCYTHGPDADIRCYERDGRLAHIARLAMPPRPVTEEHAEDYVEELRRYAEEEPGYRGVFTRTRDDLPFPERFPAFSALLVDDAERVWARVYARPGEEGERWWVFDAARLVARFDAPPGFELMEVEGDLMGGVWRDELDVEHVRVYRWTVASPGS